MWVEEFIEGLREWGLTSGLRILLVILLTLLGLRLARFASRRVTGLVAWHRGTDPEAQRRTETLSSFVRYAIAFAVLTIASITILTELGVRVGPLLAGAGIVGLAIGFGAQNLVQDVISGFFILVEDQIRVGDVIDIKGKSGSVERVGLRTTVLRDVAGTVHYIRNGHIDIVSNQTRGYSHFVFEVRASYKANVEDVIRVLKEIDEELRAAPAFAQHIIKPLEIFGVDQLVENAFVIKARATTTPLKQWAIGREFNKRLKQKFDEEKIALAVRVM